ncbi:MAG: TPM domain-containing protein [Actinomycetota bacterium]
MAAGRARIGKVRRFIDSVDDVKVVAAIRDAERNTTGQIRVHLSGRSTRDIEKAARERFAMLNMAATPYRNAVLIYLQPRSRRFFIAGDVALDEHAGTEFWQSAAGALSADLKEGRYTEGLVGAVHRAGELLAERFPKVENGPAKGGLADEITED